MCRPFYYMSSFWNKVLHPKPNARQLAAVKRGVANGQRVMPVVGGVRKVAAKAVAKAKPLKIKYWTDNRSASTIGGTGNAAGRSGTSYPPYRK